jgi:hypothetical protein
LFKPFHSIALSGEEWVPQIEKVRLASIQDQSFQKQVDHWTTKKFGFRELSVRAYNQVLYSVFNEVTHFIERGRDGYLFEKNYRKSVCGENLISQSELELKLDSMNVLASLLADKGKKLIVLIAPNKYRFYSEKVDLECNPDQTNYGLFKAGFEKADYTVFDFIELFPKMKTEYPLMPRSGTHWSLYGAFMSATMVQDSLVRWGYAGAPLEISAFETDIHPRETDKDLHDLLNVMTFAPAEELAYPKSDYHDEKKPRILVVGDSFYETFYRNGIHSNVYHKESKHLYYNKKMFGQDRSTGQLINQHDVAIELEKSDVVMIVSNEVALGTFGWGFLTDAIDILNE